MRSRPFSAILVKVYDDGDFEVSHPGDPMPSDQAAAVLRAAADLTERSPGLSPEAVAWLEGAVGHEATMFMGWHHGGQDVIEA